MKKVICIALALMAAFICFAEQSGGETKTGKEQGKKNYITVPLTRVGDMLYAPVTVDGKACLFLVDTGARDMYVAKEFAEQLELPMVDSNVQDNVLAGKVNRYIVSTKSVKIGRSIGLGPAKLVSISMPESLDPIKDSSGGTHHYAGIIGNSALAQMRAVVDFGNNKMYVPRPGLEMGADEMLGLERAIRVPLEEEDELYYVAAELGEGITARLLVDSGCNQIILLNKAFCEKQGFPIKEDEDGKAHGADGKAMKLYHVSPPKLTIGPVGIEASSLTAIDLSKVSGDRRQDGLFGAEMLYSLRTVYDARSKMMYIPVSQGCDE